MSYGLKKSIEDHSTYSELCKEMGVTPILWHLDGWYDHFLTLKSSQTTHSEEKKKMDTLAQLKA